MLQLDIGFQYETLPLPAAPTHLVRFGGGSNTVIHSDSDTTNTTAVKKKKNSTQTFFDILLRNSFKYLDLSA